MLALLALCESGRIELVSSDALLFEIGRNPSVTRREYALEILARASAFVDLGAEVEERARKLEVLGLKPLDALHLASAEAARSRYLCTCDDRFLRRARSLTDLPIQVVSPLALIGELEDDGTDTTTD